MVWNTTTFGNFSVETNPQKLFPAFLVEFENVLFQEELDSALISSCRTQLALNT